MDRTRLAPLVGIVGCLLYAGLLVVPYVLVPGSSGTAVGLYYNSGGINPVVGGFFALIAVIVFAAGREDRSPPDLVAGAALVLGLFMTTLALVWALTVPQSVVTQLSTATILQYHRGALVVTTLAVPAVAVWYARALRIF